MKKLALLLVLPLCGCLSMGKVVEQLKNDPATVDLTVTTLYGSVGFHRSFPTNWVQTPAAPPVR